MLVGGTAGLMTVLRGCNCGLALGRRRSPRGASTMVSISECRSRLVGARLPRTVVFCVNQSACMDGVSPFDAEIQAGDRSSGSTQPARARFVGNGMITSTLALSLEVSARISFANRRHVLLLIAAGADADAATLGLSVNAAANAWLKDMDLGLRLAFLFFVIVFVIHYHNRLFCHLHLLPARPRAASSGPVILNRDLQYVHEFIRAKFLRPRISLGCRLVLA
ncbi:hypothetical protein EDB83DRAFT_2373241 [Lactarius deliciosus]|nr:hypothetical protein EDB83DRAFT_2373241 [Lactarius deliciosus]